MHQPEGEDSVEVPIPTTHVRGVVSKTRLGVGSAVFAVPVLMGRCTGRDIRRDLPFGVREQPETVAMVEPAEVPQPLRSILPGPTPRNP